MIVSVDRHDVKPMREFFFGPYDSVVERRANGSFLITSTDPLRSYPLRYTERLLHWAAIKPDTVFLAQRGPDRKAFSDSFGKQFGSCLVKFGCNARRYSFCAYFSSVLVIIG